MQITASMTLDTGGTGPPTVVATAESEQPTVPAQRRQGRTQGLQQLSGFLAETPKPGDAVGASGMIGGGVTGLISHEVESVSA